MAISPTGGNTGNPAPPDSGGTGNPHNVPVEECQQRAAEGPISAEQYAQLTDDQKSLYEPDGNGGYKISKTVEDFLASEEGGGGGDNDPSAIQ